MVIDPIKMYDDFLEHKNKQHGKFRAKVYSEGQWSASSSGMCIKKHWFKGQGYEEEAFDKQKLRIFRLGTVMDQDFKDAATWWLKHNRLEKDFTLYMDKPLECKELNLSGMMDLLIVDNETKEGALYDWKTIKAYAYKLKFGRNPDLNPAISYELQLGSYKYLIEANELATVKKMSLLYYNKDTSIIKEKMVPLSYGTEALLYWKNVDNLVNLNPQIMEDNDVFNLGEFPAYAWECKGYCPYIEHCNTPFKKIK